MSASINRRVGKAGAREARPSRATNAWQAARRWWARHRTRSRPMPLPTLRYLTAMTLSQRRLVVDQGAVAFAGHSLEAGAGGRRGGRPRREKEGAPAPPL